MNTRLLLATGAAALAAALSLPAFAHSVWIEPADDGTLIARFAEPDGNLEKSPGHLDSLSPPVAFAVSGEGGAAEEILVEKKSDRFALLKSKRVNPAGLETSFVVMGPADAPGRRPIFYARWQPAGAPPPAPGMTLDLLPTGKKGEVRAVFRGEPLPGVQAIFRTPDAREVEVTADSQGRFHLPSEQKGLHSVRIARYREDLAGFHLGRPFEKTSHNACLTWVQE